MRRRIVSKTVNINDYMTICALEDGLQVYGPANSYYSIDGGLTWKPSVVNEETPVINTGEIILFKKKLVPNALNTVGEFTITKKCTLSGNCLSLIFGDDAAGEKNIQNYEDAFIRTFFSCENIIEVSSDFLPATTLSRRCYESMFNECTSLIKAPVLPATSLAEFCYREMFENCSSLESAPELPATELATSCYSSMFKGCISLSESPTLPATELEYYCYKEMFYGCSGLKKIKALFTTLSVFEISEYTENWVKGVSPTGTFVKNPEATWEIYGDYGIPNGWKVVMDGEEQSGRLQFPITLVEGDNGELGKQFYQYVKDGTYTNEEVYVIRNGYVVSAYNWLEGEDYILSSDWEVIDDTSGVGNPRFDAAVVYSNGFFEYW